MKSKIKEAVDLAKALALLNREIRRLMRKDVAGAKCKKCGLCCQHIFLNVEDKKIADIKESLLAGRGWSFAPSWQDAFWAVFFLRPTDIYENEKRCVAFSKIWGCMFEKFLGRWAKPTACSNYGETYFPKYHPECGYYLAGKE